VKKNEKNEKLFIINNCFQFNSSRDYVDPDVGLIKIYNYNTIIFDGPDQMLIRTTANIGDTYYQPISIDGKDMYEIVEV